MNFPCINKSLLLLRKRVFFNIKTWEKVKTQLPLPEPEDRFQMGTWVSGLKLEKKDLTDKSSITVPIQFFFRLLNSL